MAKVVWRYTLICFSATFIYTKVLEWTGGQKVQVLIYLTALIIPITLYFAYREMMQKHWNYKLPFLKAAILGFSVAVLSAVLLTLLNYGLMYYNAEAEVKRQYTGWRLVKYLFGYVKWYLLFALFSVPLVYGILIWQVRKK